ncbi:MAG: hypothetical protein U1F43_22530 [Myxococcota bacterium]
MASAMTDGDRGGDTARTRESALALLRAAAGPRTSLGPKLAKLGRTLGAWVSPRVLDDRFARLHALGLVEVVPNRVQVIAGSIDMVRFWITPAAADYYASKGISFWFHQLLRIADDPAAMIDPVGFFVDRDAIIGHLLQVVHANPIYDVQLLSSHADGLDELERQTRAIIAGEHPRQASIGAIVEEPDYHRRLLAFVQAFRADPTTPPLVRSNVADDPGRFGALERTFGTLPAAMRYFARLPADFLGAARHLASTKGFPLALAEPPGDAT